MPGPDETSDARREPGSRRAFLRAEALGAFVTLFGILAGHTLLETARDALFLAHIPATRLPFVYLGIALGALALRRLWTRMGFVRRDPTGLTVLLLAAAVVTLGFWPLSAWWGGNPVFYALYIWSGLLGTLTVVQFWLFLSRLVTVVEARRIYSLVVAGAIAGAITGAGLAWLVSLLWPAHVMVGAASGLFLLTGLHSWVLRRVVGVEGEEQPRREPPFRESLTVVRQSPYLRRVGGLVLVLTTALTLLDYVFKWRVADVFEPGELAGFFAKFYVLLNVLSLVVQLFVTRPVVRRLGIHRGLLVLPATVALGSVGLLLGGGTALALILKGADGTLRHSLQRTATEVLFVPLTEGVRRRAKPFIDILGHRLGQSLAAGGILLAVWAGGTVTAATTAMAVLATVAVGLARTLRPRYLDLFRENLRRGSLDAHRRHAPLDPASIGLLVDALDSDDDAEVLAAMGILAADGQASEIPARMLEHGSPDVVLSALEILGDRGRTDILGRVDRLLDHPRPELRAAALRTRTRLARDRRILERALEDPAAPVRATAMVVLGAEGHEPCIEGATEMARGDREARLALLQAIRSHPTRGRWDDLLRDLADEGGPEVRREAAGVMGILGAAGFVPHLVGMLGERELRDAARHALLRIGSPALRQLREAMTDHDLPVGVRRHLPRTLSRFPPEEVAPILLDHLVRDPDPVVRYKIMRGLGRIRAEHPQVPLDRDVLREALDRELSTAFRLLDWRLSMLAGAEEDPARRTTGWEVIVDLLADQQRNAVEHAFRLVGMLRPDEDFERVYDGLRSDRPEVRASSVELLSGVLDSELARPLVALVDERPDRDRLRHAPPWHEPRPRDYEGLQETLLGGGSEALRCLAAYHVGELRMVRFRERLEGFLRSARPPYAGVFRRALTLLEADVR
ncbi:MAG: Npt1/Npt2 family nucleotide transporter [Myxococcota bacterium]